MSLVLTKVSETSSTITLGWLPPAGVGGYVFYANGEVVSVATAKYTSGPNSGQLRNEVKFSKSQPGPPYVVTATCMQAGVPTLEWGSYPSEPPLPSNVADSAPSAVVT